ncbi:glycosyltransferase [Clostridium sp. AL.422]|uniref:glycosyltransferase n=1 Tax=Clostridium TaxID=1485 RepID=UPI00293DB41D|nr:MULTISPECIES: glycosyltransferase [unclassified Clostridium]MDV4149716.1 glycosyltransferase [Clostridium sp. AL.422]
MISLCMIVKNEGKNLEKALDSIAKYIEDIVIVDTGSIDNTKEIAKKYTNKVYDFKWGNDFSKARNFSISKATNDWVLILDADEVICKFDKEKIESFIKNNNKTVGRIKRINPFEDGKEIKKYIERVNRLFNKKYFYYEGTIHEQVVCKDKNQYKMRPIEIEAYHIGYLNEVMNKTNKLERNVKLLIEAIKNSPDDPYLYYQIGKSYYTKKDYKKAYDNFKKSIEICTDFKYEYTEDLVESYGYALLKCGNYKEAMELINYKNYYGNLPDFNFVMGLIYMNNGEFQKAIESFEKCIGEKEGKFEGINSYQPNYNIGVIYEILGLKEIAIEYYQICGEYIPAKKRIEIMLEENKYNIEEIKSSISRCIQSQDLEGAKKLIKDYFEITDKDIEVYSMKAVVEIMENRLEDAEITLKNSLKFDGKNFDILYNLGYLFELKEEYKFSVDFYTKAMILSESTEMKSQLKDYIKNIKINNFKTSIIILTYNNLDYNKICIESIKKYTNSDYEIIVVDNNSTDGTVEWLESQKDIKVIYNKENLGFPKGCNQGIRIVTGEEILLLNNDTIVTPNWLENLKECLYSSEEIAAVGPVTNSCPNYQTVPIDYTSVEEMIIFAEEYNKSEPKKWEEKLRLIGYCMLTKKDVIDKIGLLDEEFTPGNFEDDDYSFRIRNAGYKLMLCKNSFIHHFGSLSFGEVSTKYSELLRRNRRKFINKWGIDPYDIIHIEKEISDIIIEKSKLDNLEPNILHIGCLGGATLLKIKNEIPKASLYGIEKSKKVAIGIESYANVSFGDFQEIKGYNKNYFDNIIITFNSDMDSELNKIILMTIKYIKSEGYIYISIPYRYYNIDNLINNLDGIIEKLNLKYKIMKNDDKIILVLNNKDININSENPLVSILIPAFNRPKYLELALKSVINQTYDNIEIIICDDSTTDDVYKMMQKYITKYDNIRYYRNEVNLGQFENDIKLFKLANGEYVNYLMDDDLFEKTKIEKMMRYYLKDKNKEIKLITSYRKLIDEEGLLLDDNVINSSLFNEDTIIDGITLGNYIIKLNHNIIGEPTTVLFRKADLTEAFGSFDNRKYGCNVDIASWLHLLSKGKAIYISEPLSYFRIHSGQQLQSKKMRFLGSIDYGYEILSGYKHGYLKDRNSLNKAIKYFYKYIYNILKEAREEKVYYEYYNEIIYLIDELYKLFNMNNKKNNCKNLKFLLRRIEVFNDIDYSMKKIERCILNSEIEDIDIIFNIIKHIFETEDITQIVAAWLLQNNEYDMAIELFSFALDIDPYNVNNIYNYLQALVKANKKEEAVNFLNDSSYDKEIIKVLKKEIMDGE